MTVISTRITVGPDGAISVSDPLPAGEYEAELTVGRPPIGRPFSMEGFPTHNLGWDDSVSLRREDMYGDDGR